MKQDKERHLQMLRQTLEKEAKEQNLAGKVVISYEEDDEGFLMLD